MTPGQAHETTAFKDLVQQAAVPLDDCGDAYPVHLAGDKGYDAQWIRDWLIGEEIEPVISHRDKTSPQDNLPFDRELYRGRNVVERLVGRLKECRRIFSRFEKIAINYLGMLKLGMILYYLRLFCPTGF